MPPALKIIHSLETIPLSFTASIFLAGPPDPPGTPPAAPCWRQEAVDLLAAAGYDGLVFWPDTSDAGTDPERLLLWEQEALHHADAILIWIPDVAAMLDPATVDLWGAWKRSGKVVFGAHRGAQVRTQRLSAGRLRVPAAFTLHDAVNHALPLLRPGVRRAGGERAVPLLLWRSPAFQRWYRALRAAGNDLDDIEVEWTYRPRAAPGRPPLIWAVRPRVWVRRERRHKAGEVVVGRAEVSATVLYHPAPVPMDTKIVLVREFRSAGTSASGFVLELPGGSAEHAADRDQDPHLTALREVQQETGLALDPAQLLAVPLGARQIAATILSHRAHLYRARLTDAQLAALCRAEQQGRPFGANPGERCYVVVRPLGEVLHAGELDWSQLGMVLFAFQDLLGGA